MTRFYYSGPLAVGMPVTLPEPVAHHLRVLRLPMPSSIVLFNGSGGEYVATLAAIDKKSAVAEVKAFAPREAELPYPVTLAQALPEAAKMDWIIEKAVELGATTLQPLAAQRCVTRLTAERAARKMQHWEGIVVSASEQSGRNRLLQLAEPAEFTKWITQQDGQSCILLTPHAQQSLSAWAHLNPAHPVTLMIGPEGGWTGQEEAAAIEHGALALSMGPRVLRTETAGLAALAALNAAWGGI